jgi:signal transduction histidine kinase
MALDESTNALNLRRRYVEGLLFRAIPCLLFVVSFVVAATFNIGLTWGQITPVVWLLSALVVVNVPYWFVGKARGFPLGDFYVHWGLDLITITVIVYYLGGIDMPLVQFAYLLMIMTAAIFVSQRTAYHLAVGATVVYGVLGIVETTGIVPLRAGVWAHHYGTEARTFIIVSSAVFFFVVAYLAGTMSRLLRDANEELAKTKAIVEDQNRALEGRVRERTRDLEAQTQQLEERTDELQEMVHIVTHDLQNVSVASTETARKLVELAGAQLSERGQRYADRLVRDCRLMSTMLRNLLQAASQSEVAVADRRDLVDVQGLVRDAVARAQSVLEAKKIEVVVGELPPVYGEEQKLGHVFDNLLSNACKYVGDKPTARIDVSGSVENGGVEYVVRDNGVGIDPTQLGRIFQLYHRAPEQTVAGVVQQGHGIGLAVVKRIVQRYGGKIWVESTPGEGASFHVRLPREAEAEK